MPSNEMSLDEFYEDNARAHSEEVSFGRGWRDGSPGEWQASWVRDTGEFFVVAPTDPGLGGGGGAGGGNPLVDIAAGFLLDVALDRFIHKGEKVGVRRQVEVLGVVPDEDRLNAMLKGWEEHEASPSGLAWLRAQF